MNPGEAPIAEMRATLNQEFDVVLVPVSNPALGVIRISESLFAIGRSEAPFADYPHETVARLSRRHARIFSEQGAVYVADLDSKNGTSVNGISVCESPSRVRAGDELCFGGELAYRVGIEPRAFDPAAARAAQLLGVTLIPERADLGLEPIDITAFPFLVSKTDALFARYKERFPHQVNYISRRHAHLFLRGGEPYVEDLGSTNGTFVGGKRLDESAVELHDGDVLGFGGDHFVYRVKVHKPVEIEPTVTHLMARNALPDNAPQPASASPDGAVAGRPAPVPEPAVDMDKTTFVGAAHSFLDIFYVDRAVQREDEVNEAARPASVDRQENESRKRKPRHLIGALASEFARTFAGGDRTTLRRIGFGSVATLIVIAAIATVLHMRGSSLRELKHLLASGDDEQAVAVANSYLTHNPADDAVKALASEALMKARVPGWVDAVRARQFDRAAALIGGMRATSAGNTDTAPLIDELQWVGDLERFALRRDGAAGSSGAQPGGDAPGGDPPIRIYGDEDRINGLLQHWNDDPKSHQRTLDRIASYVPQFADPYAVALSHLRKLQSDDSVYVAAIDRLNATINAELARDKPDVLTAIFDDYAQRYPRLAGLDALRDDLRQYTGLLNVLLARRLTELLTRMKQVRFTTPPFVAQYRQFAASRLPSADAVRQLDAVLAAWQRGDVDRALDGLQHISSGAWSTEISAEYAHKKALAAQFADLRRNRGGKDYEQRLLSFYAGLNPTEDSWFAHAIAPDVAAVRDNALAHAHDQLERAQTWWRQYRANGSIGGTQRLESGISERFRSQARLLTDAQASAQRGMRVYTQLKADHPSQWDQMLEDIDAEAALQRRSLEELRMVLEPNLLKTKLALIGADDDEARSSP
ncbi:FHA domain-containing protein [Paraburkholderia rhizosphaerae]|uniref:FHA domain-containing protein n=1 Tax=Paraburkholderia rhizosphaerae TaxID=480658 RepID=A0A4R8L7N8_9BURK|nr:FHA domain-containing protein [Paraburkholderia rhizosphaerae]TDY38742.1 FHA domain-containing protein [Paraburkholderia rhizosphaerae]